MDEIVEIQLREALEALVELGLVDVVDDEFYRLAASMTARANSN
jgi:hypothetical protein